MIKDSMKDAAVAAEPLLFDDWFDAIEEGVRSRVRGFIETMLEEELSVALSRPRYGRSRLNGGMAKPPAVIGVRHGHRKRGLTGTFGRTEISVPRARLRGADGRTSEWRSASLRLYQRRTRAADALIAGAYLSGTNTRRVRRALAAVFAGAGRKGRGQPGVAEGEGRLGRLERAAARRGADRAADPRRHRLSASASTNARPRSRCSSPSACGPTVRKCCWRSAAWAGKARPPGERCSTISFGAG